MELYHVVDILSYSKKKEKCDTKFARSKRMNQIVYVSTYSTVNLP